MKRINLYYILTAIVVVALASFGVWRLSSNKATEPGNKPATSQETSSVQQSTNQQTNKTYPVVVYFSKHPDSDNDPSRTFAVNRTSSSLGVANFAVTQLLKGPSSSESAQGYFTTTRLRSSTVASDFKLTITNGVATLQFLKPFDHLGVVADGQAESEIKATLEQFSTVKKVIILNAQGDCEFNLSGQNLCQQ